MLPEWFNARGGLILKHFFHFLPHLWPNGQANYFVQLLPWSSLHLMFRSSGLSSFFARREWERKDQEEWFSTKRRTKKERKRKATTVGRRVLSDSHLPFYLFFAFSLLLLKLLKLLKLLLLLLLLLCCSRDTKDILCDCRKLICLWSNKRFERGERRWKASLSGEKKRKLGHTRYQWNSLRLRLKLADTSIFDEWCSQDAVYTRCIHLHSSSRVKASDPSFIFVCFIQ